MILKVATGTDDGAALALRSTGVAAGASSRVTRSGAGAGAGVAGGSRRTTTRAGAFFAGVVTGAGVAAAASSFVAGSGETGLTDGGAAIVNCLGAGAIGVVVSSAYCQ